MLADPHVFMEVSAREGPAQAESEVSMPSGLAHNKPEVRTPKRPAQKESGIRVREELFCQSWWTACGEELFCLTRRSPCRPVQRRPHQRPVRCLDLPQFRQRSRCCVVLCGCMVACQAACEPQLVTSTAGPAVGPRTQLVTVAGDEVGPLVRSVIHATRTFEEKLELLLRLVS